MDVEGHAFITSSQGIDTLVDAITSPHMNEDMLVSWVDLQAMGRAPKGFPTKSSEQEEEAAYVTILSKTLPKANVFKTNRKSGKIKNNLHQTDTTEKSESERRTQAGNGRT